MDDTPHTKKPDNNREQLDADVADSVSVEREPATNQSTGPEENVRSVHSADLPFPVEPVEKKSQSAAKPAIIALILLLLLALGGAGAGTLLLKNHYDGRLAEQAGKIQSLEQSQASLESLRATNSSLTEEKQQLETDKQTLEDDNKKLEDDKTDLEKKVDQLTTALKEAKKNAEEAEKAAKDASSDDLRSRSSKESDEKPSTKQSPTEDTKKSSLVK